MKSKTMDSLNFGCKKIILFTYKYNSLCLKIIKGHIQNERHALPAHQLEARRFSMLFSPFMKAEPTHDDWNLKLILN